MKVEHAKALIPLLQAYAEGKTIEMYSSYYEHWKDENGTSKYAVIIKVDELSLAPGSFQAKEQQQDTGYNGVDNYQQSAPAAEENYSSQDFNIPDEIPF